jgi:hypothetical protein
MSNRTRVRVGLLATAAALAACAALATSARAGGYHLLECHDWGGAWAVDDSVHWDAQPGSQDVVECPGSPHPLFGVQTHLGNGPGVVGQYAMYAPGGLTVTAVRANVKLRRAGDVRAQFGWIGGDGIFRPLDGLDPADATWRSIGWFELPQAAAVGVRLICTANPCPQGNHPAQAFMSHVQAVILDPHAPAVTEFSGPLATQGTWWRGQQHLRIAGHDAGAGVAELVVSVNGHWIGRQGWCPRATATWPYVVRGRPCEASLGPVDVVQDTAAAPWRNGCENAVAVLARDWTGDASWTGTRQICVDNAAPALAFENEQHPEDPELIRAPVSDAHSGIKPDSWKIALRAVGARDWIPLETARRDGALEARVDSSAYPPGIYELQGVAADVAGNQAVTTKRANGEPMRLEFPLRQGAQLTAHLEPSGAEEQTVRYGQDSYAAGRLVDARGVPLTEKTITVIEHFGDGALIRERVSRVQTNADGRWSSKLPAGPSRAVTARFDGTPKYMPQEAAAGKLAVKSRTRFRPSQRRVHEGESIVFRGKLGRKGARIPVGGKLVEVQVRLEKGRWDTVKRPFYTDNDGRFRLRYRFGRFYVDDVRYQFRARVLRESDWPYKPSRSRKRTVVVIAR